MPSLTSPRLGETTAEPRAPPGASADPDQEATQAQDHLLKPAVTAPQPAFPAHSVPGAAREGSAGRTTWPHPDPGGASPFLPTIYRKISTQVQTRLYPQGQEMPSDEDEVLFCPVDGMQ